MLTSNTFICTELKDSLTAHDSCAPIMHAHTPCAPPSSRPDKLQKQWLRRLHQLVRVRGWRKGCVVGSHLSAGFAHVTNQGCPWSSPMAAADPTVTQMVVGTAASAPERGIAACETLKCVGSGPNKQIRGSEVGSDRAKSYTVRQRSLCNKTQRVNATEASRCVTQRRPPARDVCGVSKRKWQMIGRSDHIPRNNAPAYPFIRASEVWVLYILDLKRSTHRSEASLRSVSGCEVHM